MIDIAKELAVQSYCFRNFTDIPTFLARVAETGMRNVELCGVHVKPHRPETFDAILAAHRAAGIKIVSYGVYGFNLNEAEDRAVMEFCKAAGVHHMSVDFKPDTFHAAYPAAQKLAEQYDIRLMIHNHGGRHWLGSAQMLEYVFSQTSDRIGLCLDTAWALHSHEDPVKFAERFASRLYGLHLKDFTFHRDGSFTDAIVGTGNLDLDALRNVLRQADFNGPAVLEFEGSIEDPVPEVVQCVANIRKHMNA